MLSVVIHLCLVLAVLCAATESFRPSTHASIRKFSKELGAARRPHSTHERWRERPRCGRARSSARRATGRYRAGGEHRRPLSRAQPNRRRTALVDDRRSGLHPIPPRPQHRERAGHLVPSLLYNLVRSDHRSLVDPALAHDYDDRETYIVEPQTGDIFVLVPDSEGERDREMAVSGSGIRFRSSSSFHRSSRRVTTSACFIGRDDVDQS
ncbi:Serine/threonine-protein kinase [Ceratobasidium sp. AG-Ba]|nr:Serine/threonine-protein kinase [Ceratobasidium sp. AG-Ba]